MRNRTLTLLVALICACAQAFATQYCQIATGHQNDASFGDPAGRILLSLEPTANANEYKLTARANIEDGNTKQVDYLYVTGSNGVTINPNPSISDMEGSGVGSDELYVTFTCTSEMADFTIMWSYPDWDGRYQCTVSDVVLSELEACNSASAQTVYFINAAQWGGVRVVVQTWDESTENWVVSSRGEATLTTEQVNNYGIYAYALPEGYTRYGLTFQDTQNSDYSHTTMSLVLPADKPYFCVSGLFNDFGYSHGYWYTSIDDYIRNAQNKHIQYGDLYYNLSADSLTAKVTYDAYESTYGNNYPGLADLVIPDILQFDEVAYRVIGIDEKAFYYCQSINSIIIPSNITSIGASAFFSCTNLQDITCHALTPPTCSEYVFTGVNNELPVYVPAESIEAYKASEGWKDFTNIQAIAGTGQQEIIASGYCGADGDSTNITWVLTSDSVLTIRGTGEMANWNESETPWHEYKDNIIKVRIEEGILSIGNNAFNNYRTITSVEFPNSLTSIGSSAFLYGKGLLSLTIPKNVTQIDAKAFSGCSSLTKMTCEAVSPPTIARSTLPGDKSTFVIFVPAESVEAYQAADGWKEFTNIYAIGSEQVLSIPAACTIDGNFDDWEKVPSEILAEAQADENASKDALYRIKVFTNVDYIYFYLEFDSTSYSYTNDDAVVIGSVVDVVNIFMNIDDDPLTGWNSWMWTNSGIDYLIEGMLSNNFADVGLYAFSGINQDEWGWDAVDAENGLTFSDKIQLPNGHMAVEGSIKIAAIPTKIKNLKVGIHTANSSWDDTGVLPQMAIESDGSVSSQQMLEVPLNYGASKDSSETVTPEPNVITIFGEEVVITDSTGVGMDEVDVLGDSTMIYTPEDNTLTLNNVDLTVGEDETTAISYTGTETLVIVLNETSTIIADTVISSTADVVITGDGELVAEGTVPIIGVPTATITFDSVTMYVHSTSSPQALRRRIKSGKMLDETGGPALSGFGNADFNKTTISPSGAMYGAVNIPDGNGGLTATNALYILNGDGEQVVLTEFRLTAEEGTGVEDVRANRKYDPTQPAYNILGLQVDASYRGLVIQNGRSYLVIDN